MDRGRGSEGRIGVHTSASLAIDLFGGASSSLVIFKRLNLPSGHSVRLSDKDEVESEVRETAAGEVDESDP